MSAPSDDFESADYEALRACSLSARGLWSDMRVLMKRSRRRGYLQQDGKPISLRQLALTTGCPTDEARLMLGELIAAGICAHSESEGYFSPRMVAFESFRRKCSKAGKKGGGSPILRQPLGVGPKVGPKDERGPPSPALSPPKNPLLSHPHSPLPFAAQTAGGVESLKNGVGSTAGEAAAAPPQPKARNGNPGKFPSGVWQRACEGWDRAFAFVHGCKFRWDSRQARGLRDVLDAIGADLPHFERVVKAWLLEPEVGKAKGHPLYQLAEDLNYVESRIARGQVGHDAGTNGSRRRSIRGEGDVAMVEATLGLTD